MGAAGMAGGNNVEWSDGELSALEAELVMPVDRVGTTLSQRFITIWGMLYLVAAEAISSLPDDTSSIICCRCSGVIPAGSRRIIVS